MKTRVHISIEVADLSRSLAFYSALFQQPASKVKPDYANFRLDTPALHLALVHAPGRTPASHSNQHFGVELFDEAKLQQWLEAVKMADIPVRLEDNVTCCYAVANKFWAQDPDGHAWEFWVRSAEADAMHGDKETLSEEIAREAPRCCAPGSSCAR